MTTAVPVVVAAATAALVRRRWNPSAPASTARWILESLALGGTGTALGTLLPELFASAPVLAPDFDQYCAAVSAVRAGDLAAVPPQRGVIGSLLPGLLARPLGVVDGLLGAAWLGRLGVMVGLAAWVRAAGGGRMGAAVAVATVLSVHPLWTLGRTLAFYPQWLAVAVATCATATWAVRQRSASTVALAGACAACSLLVDVRGLLAALPALGVALGVAGVLPDRRKAAASIGAIVLSLGASYWVAHAVVPLEAPGIEQQGLRYLEEAVMRRDAPGRPSLEDALMRARHEQFLWGHRQARGLAGSLSRLSAEQQRVATHLDTVGRAVDPVNSTTRHLGAFPLLAALGGGIWLVGAARRRDPELLATTICGAPFVLSLVTASTVVGGARYFAAGAPVLVLGLAMGVAEVGRAIGRRGRRHRTPSGIADLAPAIVLCCFVLGFLPSAWHPTASWRSALWGDEEPAQTLKLAWEQPVDGERAVLQECLDGLRRDRERGLPRGSRLLGWESP